MSLLSLLGLGQGSARAREALRIEPRTDASPSPAAQMLPSVDPGVAAVTEESLLTSHEDLLARIKLCYGADKAAFEQDLLDPIRRLAAYVNVLPATPDNYFCELGGLFRLALEVGFYALQGTDGHIVSGRATISTRRQLEPRWRLATFFAGLCSELHRTLSMLVVTDERGEEWPAYLGPLTSWLAQRKSPRFFIRWMPKATETRALGLFAIPHVISAAKMQHLATGNGVVVPQLLASIAGIPLYRDQNVLVDLVKRATALVINRNLVANANRYGRPILGAHIERYLIDAMRRLVVSHAAWVPNQERSRVWHGPEGLFIVWPNAVAEIRKLLEEDALPGIPQSPQTILEILTGAGVFVPAPGDQPLWTVTPPGKAPVEAVKLASPEILLLDPGDHKPLQQPLIPGPNAPKPPKPHAGTADPPQPVQRELPLGGPEQPALPEDAKATAVSDGKVVAPPPAVQTNATKPPSGPSRSEDPVFRLAAPMRLQPHVRDALAAAIDTMNGDAKHALAVTVPTGIFVPLDHFKKSNVDLPVVLRALGELDMAICGKPGRPNTVQHELAGQEVLGFVLRPQFVDGLDPALFATQP